MAKFLKILFAVALGLIIFISIISAEKHKDVNTDLQKIIDELSSREIMIGFINKYGKQYFRPTSTITREDLVMALYEYDKVTRTLIEYKKMLAQRVSQLKKGLARVERKMTQQKSPSLDKAIAEIKQMIPGIIQAEPITVSMKEDIAYNKAKISTLEQQMDYETILEIVQDSVPLMLEKELRKSGYKGNLAGDRPVAFTTDIDRGDIVRIIKSELPKMIQLSSSYQEIHREISSIRAELDLLTQLTEDFGEDMFVNFIKKSPEVKKALKSEIKDFLTKEKKL